MPVIAPTRIHDCHSLAANMRKADIREVRASSGGKPIDALVNGWSMSSSCQTVFDDSGVPMFIFGVVPSRDAPETGHPWMLARYNVNTISKWMIENTHTIVSGLHSQHPHLFNFVDARNRVHIRWLRWAGFTLKDPIVHGVEKRPFIPFERTLSHV